MNFKEVIGRLQGRGYSFEAAGFINIESGTAAIAADYFEFCDFCPDLLGPVQETCPHCGRGPGTFFRIPSGDGDGVYVVFQIRGPGPTPNPIGALIVFDNKYQIADYVRDSILEEKLPDTPFNFFEQFGSTEPIFFGEIPNSGRILLSDASAGSNSNYATVNLKTDPEVNLVALSFVEEISQDPLMEAERLQRVAGMDRRTVLTLIEELIASSKTLENPPRGYGTLPSLSFRVLLVLARDAFHDCQIETRSLEIDWETLTGQFMGAIVTSHTETMEHAAIWFNFLLAREIDRATGEVSSEEAKDLLFGAWTWAYQGLHNGDGDYLAYLENRYLPTPEEVVSLLDRRGLVLASSEFLSTGRIGGNLVRTKASGQNQNSLNQEVHFDQPPKVIASEGDSIQNEDSWTNGKSESQGATQSARFCGNCGSSLAERGFYCGSCGMLRP